MKPGAIQHLADIRQACRYLIEFAGGRGVEDYESDAHLRSALARQFQIAGEALNRLRKTDHEIAGRISEYHRVIAFRNVIVHGYDTIDPYVLWDVLRKQVPVLLREVEQLLREAEGL